MLYPELLECVNNALPEAERFADENLWLVLAPQSETPQGTIYAAIRDPVERFLSACAMFGMKVEEGLLSKDAYFQAQYDFVKDAEAYLLPDHEKEFCAATKLPYPLPVLGKGPAKPLINAKQRIAIEERYKVDLLLIESLR